MKQKLNSFDDPGAKLLTHGSSALSESENLSIIISGKDALEKAKKIMAKVNYQYADLARLSYHDMLEEGLTHTQCLHVLACNNYAHRKASQVAAEIYDIRSSKDMAEIMFPLIADLNHEELWIVFLNRSNRVIAKEKISHGGETGTITDIRIIMRKAIGHHAQGLIVSHNHPSGNLNPSESDRSVTKKIKEAAAIFDIQLLDHIIIAGNEHYSFADNGIL